MRINKYKLKKNTTLADDVSFGARDGGGWIKKGSKYFLSKKFYYKETDLSVSINITFEDKLSEWNDFDNVLVLDEDFGQPYTPFYGDNYKRDVQNSPSLVFCIEKYNEYMDSIPFFEKILGD